MKRKLFLIIICIIIANIAFSGDNRVNKELLLGNWLDEMNTIYVFKSNDRGFTRHFQFKIQFIYKYEKGTINIKFEENGGEPEEYLIIKFTGKIMIVINKKNNQQKKFTRIGYQ